jgi:serine/threonine-protein kinase
MSERAMTAERWRAVDTILRGALDCAPDRRADFVRDACGTDETLRLEVVSLLGAHDAMATDFLEQPAVLEPLGPAPLVQALAGRYEIEREIAHGGMATVYRARDVRHERAVAIKVMRDEVAAVVGAERFLEEIRVTALLQHPHILPLFDSGSVGGLLWYVMPLVDGETLRSRLARDGKLPIDEAVRIAREIADALEHAHAHGIVHRDIKPENVLLQGGHALVADFGIALALEHAGAERLTRTGLTLGTPQYMAPEQAAGERALDARVDVSALGAVLYEMLAGVPPFIADSREAILRMLRDPPAALGTHRADIPPAIDAAVSRALEKRAADRFESASAFAKALFGPPPERAKFNNAGSSRDVARAPSGRVTPPAKGVVRTRVAVLAAIGGIGVGLFSGWGIAHSSTPQWLSPIASTKTEYDNGLADAGRGAPGPPRDGLGLVVVDRGGKVLTTIDANRPWTPRFSRDGRRVAYGAYGAGRTSSDVWVTDLASGATQRITDDDADSNDPQWSADGNTLAYSVNAPGGKDLAMRRLGESRATVFAARNGTQFASDWLRDGRAFIVTDDARGQGLDIVVQPADGSAAKPYVATAANESAGRVSPDEHWIAYMSNEEGRDNVYLDSYPRPGHRVLVSPNGGMHPAWRGDGKELYYWRGDQLVAVRLSASGDAASKVEGETVLFRAHYDRNSLNTMYDVSAAGDRFVIVTSGGGSNESPNDNN